MKKTLPIQGSHISVDVKGLLATMPTSTEKREIDIVRLKVSDLGFTRGTRYDKIQKRAVELGLALAPAEAGPALRLSMQDQPMGDYLIVGMEALTARDGALGVFVVDHGGGRSVAQHGRWEACPRVVSRPPVCVRRPQTLRLIRRR